MKDKNTNFCSWLVKRLPGIHFENRKTSDNHLVLGKDKLEMKSSHGFTQNMGI